MWLDRIRQWGERVPHLPTYLLGFALMQIWLYWMLDALRGELSAAPQAIPDVRELLNVGEIIGSAIAITVARKWGCLYRSPSFIIISAASMLVGNVAFGLLYLGVGLPLPAWVGVALVSGAGYMALSVAWVEAIGLHEPSQATLAFAWNFILLVLWPLVARMGGPLADAVVALAGIASVPMLVKALIARDASALELRRLDVRSVIRPIAWFWAFAVAYGVGSMHTRMGYSTIESALGMAAPMLVLVVLMWVRGENASYVLVYRLALMSMIAGMAGCALGGPDKGVTQVFLSGSFATAYMLVASHVCGIARLRRASAGPAFAVMRIGFLAFAIVGESVSWLCARAGVAWLDTAVFLAVVAVMVVAAWLYRDVDLASQFSKVDEIDGVDPVTLQCRSVARRVGLGERETAVLLMLAQGKSQAQAASELFIAPGTVRAHVSHIYAKLDVHSREEMLELIRSEPLA